MTLVQDEAGPAPDPDEPPVESRPVKRHRVPMNPVLARELKDRLRGRRAWITITAYLVLLAGIVFLVYKSASGSGFSPNGDVFAPPSPTRFATVGRTIFEWLIMFMLLLVLFLVPGLTSGAVAGERERQTLVPLQVTLLRPWQILIGKLGASFAFLALLVVATTPLLSIAYLIGGVSIGNVLRGVAVVLFTGLVLACTTLFCSAFFRRVQAATVAAYGVVLMLTLGTFLIWGAASMLDRSRGTDPSNPPAELLLLNPLFTAADVLGEDTAITGVDSPFDSMKRVLLQSRSNGGVFQPVGDIGFPDQGFGTDPNGRPIIGFDQNGNPIFAVDETGFPYWAKSALALYGLAVAGMVLAGRRLRTPSEVER